MSIKAKPPYYSYLMLLPSSVIDEVQGSSWLYFDLSKGLNEESSTLHVSRNLILNKGQVAMDMQKSSHQLHTITTTISVLSLESSGVQVCLTLTAGPTLPENRMVPKKLILLKPVPFEVIKINKKHRKLELKEHITPHANGELLKRSFSHSPLVLQ